MADNITVLDSSGNPVTLRLTDNAGVKAGMSIPASATGVAAWGTAGAANANVMTIQGIASGTVVPISGAVTVSSGTTTVTQATGTNLHVVVDSGTVSTSGSNSYTHIATSTTTNAIKSGAGTLVRIVVNQTGTVASLISVFDNTTATGTTIAIIDGLTRTGNYDYGLAFATGLSIITTGTAAPDITVVWS